MCDNRRDRCNDRRREAICMLQEGIADIRQGLKNLCKALEDLRCHRDCCAQENLVKGIACIEAGLQKAVEVCRMISD